MKWLVGHHKIDVNQRNRQGETALHGSLRSGNIDIADWLLDNGAEMTTETTYSHESPLHWLISTEGEDSHRMVRLYLFHIPVHGAQCPIWVSMSHSLCCLLLCFFFLNCGDTLSVRCYCKSILIYSSKASCLDWSILEKLVLALPYQSYFICEHSPRREGFLSRMAA